jgi:hypothetical protein
MLGLQAKDFPRTFLAQLAAPFRDSRDDHG